MKPSAIFLLIMSTVCASAQTTYTVSTLYTFPASNTGPTGIAVDSKGNIYSAGNFATYPNAPGIAQIFPPTSSGGNGSAVVFAGGSSNGSNDGTGSAAQFNYPEGMATDAAGNIYVADVQSANGGGTVREIVPTTGIVTTLSGLNGNTQIFNGLGGISGGGAGADGVTVNSSGNVYVTIGGTTPNDSLAQYVPGSSPISISTGQIFPQSFKTYGVAVDSSNNLYVTAVGSTNPANLFIPTQLFVGMINGTSTNQLFGLPLGANSMLEPNLGLITGPVPIAVDSIGNLYVGWYGNLYLYNNQGGPTEIATIGGPIVGLATDSSGRIYVASGPPGYLSNDNVYGPGLLSIVAPPGVAPLPAAPSPTPTPTPTPTAAPVTRFTNISTRAYVGTGSSVAIAGFNISGVANEQVLIRGIGPTLSIFSVSGVLAQPVMTLYDSTGTPMATNSGWGTNSNPSQISAAFAAAGAFALPSGSADSALLVNLAPGSYTAQVSGLNNTTGNALIEVYQVPTPTPTPTPTS